MQFSFEQPTNQNYVNKVGKPRLNKQIPDKLQKDIVVQTEGFISFLQKQFLL